MLGNRDLYWLAGIIEGEGSFGAYKRGKWSVKFKLGIVSTDIDVIESVKRIILIEDVTNSCMASILAVKDSSPISKKILYTYTIYSDFAIHWMKLLLPLMHERRGQKIREIISIWEDYDAPKSTEKAATNSRLFAQRRLKKPKSSVPISTERLKELGFSAAM